MNPPKSPTESPTESVPVEAPLSRSEQRVSTTILVCRGCCCGTVRKHPNVDHDAHLERLRTGAGAAGVKVCSVDCLGPCKHSNVLAVRRGSTRYWLGHILEDEQVEHVINWVASDEQAPPPELTDYLFENTNG